MVSISKDLPNILQRFIDFDAKQANLLIVLSGSSQQMMQGLILNPKAPLYGRAQEILKILPISHTYIGRALNLQDPLDQFKAYSIWGGIPRYWELASSYSHKLLESINELILDQQGILYDEPNRLLLEEIPSAMVLRPLLDAIGCGMHRLSEIAGRLGQPSTSLSRSIERLKELDFIEREIPFGASEVNSKCALYKIKDPFLYFWFNLVAARKSLLAQLDAKIRLNWLTQQLQPIWAYAWKNLCRNNIHLFINKNNNKFGKIIFEPAKRFWHGNEPEWDIVANSLDHQSLLLGEVKWSNKSTNINFLKEILLNLFKKGMPVKLSNNINVYYVICIPQKPNIIFDLPERVILVDIKDLFSI